MLRLEKDRTCPAMDNRHMQGLFKGILEIFRKPPLALAAFALLLAYASAHASNALLAGFARFELKLSSDLYGWVAAMYSGGGLIGSVALACFSNAVRERVLIAAGTAFLAAATGGFSTAQTISEAVLWQGLIGLSFMMIRAGSDVMVLKVVVNQMVGRVRSNIDAAVGLTAISIYLLPSLIPDVRIRLIYLGLAGLFACGSGAIVWAQWTSATAEQKRLSRSRSGSSLP
ncbi:hypothetical protein [Mesorhizobium sp. WSM2239]|uniref:MFS transporter n=2 Tax=unclassified Mesorhizobium TaxID=325217 RepID=A0AAU8DJ43_9HYPH